MIVLKLLPRLAAAGLLLFLILAPLAQDKTTEPPKQEEGPLTLRIDVDLVVLNVTVVNESGVNVTNLRKEDFTVYEDGVEQEINSFYPVEAPFHLFMILDSSSSTRSNLHLLKRAAANFVDELRPDDRIALGEINAFVRQLQDFTSDRKALKSAIQSITTYPYGGSKVYDGISMAAKALRHLKTGRKAIVILSDGMENSSAIKFEGLRQLVAQGDAVLYPITILNKKQQQSYLEDYIHKHSEDDPYVRNARASLSVLEEVYQIQTERLQVIAEESGGRIFMVNDLGDLSGKYSEIAQELRNTFSLAYYSKNPWNEGTMRKIQVEVKNPGYRVRSRSTFYVGNE
ncbi:MAG: VWA domain-containing protein [Terriglobia bacterium]